MIEQTDAINIFYQNLDRTNMLIEAMEKIKAYNRIYQDNAYRIYQDNAYRVNLEFGRIVEKSQNEQLIKIEISCAEHAIISLSTLFETYYKELIQQLLYEFPQYFLSKKTKYSDKLNRLISSRKCYTEEDIALKLNLSNRFQYYNFFKLYEIEFLSKDDSYLIEYIYTLRNCFVHNAGKLDKKTLLRLKKNPSPVEESYRSTESKILRTKMKRLIPKLHKRIISKVSKQNKSFKNVS